MFVSGLNSADWGKFLEKHSLLTWQSLLSVDMEDREGTMGGLIEMGHGTLGGCKPVLQFLKFWL